MRCANEAIQRERHITTTLEDILKKINSSKRFTKIDINSAYHQIELAEHSRYVTTFSTHLGLYRYKRLLFGISLAHEIFHYLIENFLATSKVFLTLVTTS